MVEFVLEQLKNNEFLKGGFILSIFAATGMWLKSLLPIIWDRIIRKISFSTTIESKTDLYYIFNDWLYNNHKDKYRKVILETSAKGRVRPNSSMVLQEADSIEADKLICTETNYHSVFWFWYKGTPFLVSSSREKFEASSFANLMHIDNYTITSYFSKNKLRILLDELIEDYNNKIVQQKGVFLYDYRNYNGWRRSGIIKSKPYDKIFNSEKVELEKDISQFLNSKKYYEDRGIPYRRGFLLYGAPGNGKTSTILALAQKFKKNVYNINISSLENDQQLKDAFSELTEDSFLILEDVDVSVKGRETPNKVNFNTLLNVLDGVLSKENICIFFTTNHKDLLDEALLRCGRMDKKIEFKNPTKEDAVQMIELFFEQPVGEFEYNDNFCASELQEIMINSNSVSEVLVQLENKEKVTV